MAARLQFLGGRVLRLAGIVVVAAAAAAAGSGNGGVDTPGGPEAWLLGQVDELEHRLDALREQRAARLGEIGEQARKREEAVERRLLAVEAKRRKLQAKRRLAAAGVTVTDAEALRATSEAAQEVAVAIADLSSAVDHTWLILCGALVMFMQSGFAMVEAGTCRIKSAQNVLMKNLVDVCVGTMCWWAIGWPLAYGVADGENHGFANSREWFSTGFTTVDADGMFTPSTKMGNWFFQWAFASAAATIVSGGVAERIQFPGYLVFTVCMTSFIYPVIAHWTWGGGWLSGGESYSLNSVGFLDFAGSGVVHLCGGVGALVGATVVGPRNGRFIGPGNGEAFDPHNLPLVVLGTMILWLGWYGFNAGSTLEMHNARTGMLAAQVAMNTTIAASAAGLTVLALRYLFHGKFDIPGLCNGLLSGLVSITAGCANVECGAACGIAIIGAFVYQFSSTMLKRLHIDDPIDAFSVHGACGAWGVLAAVLFDWGTGLRYFNGASWSCVGSPGPCKESAWSEAFAANVAQIAVVFAWTAGWSFVIFVPLRITGNLRCSDEVQEKGVDASKHSQACAYSIGN